GLAWGALAATVVVLAAAVPASRPLFRDRRMAGVGARGTAWCAAVRIPFGTVVLEEVAFRGVLAALGVPAAVSATLFGLWHVRPTAKTLGTNRITRRRTRAAALAAAVVATAVAGFGLSLLRTASGGLLAPAIVHVAITSTATVASFVAFARYRRATWVSP
ncbi:MAG: CPBP family glutamic-type intramembrane protease, partial [Acidimicrobiales bacterium]